MNAFNTTFTKFTYSKDSHATVVTKYFATITTLFLQCIETEEGRRGGSGHEQEPSPNLESLSQ